MEIAVLAVLILLNGFFALSEIALVSSKRSRLEQEKTRGSKGAKISLHLLDNSENFLSAVQVGITLIGIVTGVYGGMNIADDVAPFFKQFAITAPYSHQLALTITVFIITYVSIVIGELVPKTIALSNPEKIAIRVAPTIHYFSSAFYPFVKLLSISTNLINKLLGIQKNNEQLTEAELRQMLKTASTEGVIEKEQNAIHENIFYFSDKRAKHIMTHRTDLEWIDISKPEGEIEAFLMQAQHNKIVCSHGRLDNFKGILDVRVYFKAKFSGAQKLISELLVQPIIVPENTDAQRVLHYMRINKSHTCCVVDEYGGFEGIITMHDIIEKIVGEIPDEGDLSEPVFYIREDKSVLINGDAPVEILTELIDDFTIDFEQIDYATVAGFVLEHLNKIAQIGDKIQYLNYTIEIIDLDGNRIDKVLLTKNE